MSAEKDTLELERFSISLAYDIAYLFYASPSDTDQPSSTRNVQIDSKLIDSSKKLLPNSPIAAHIGKLLELLVSAETPQNLSSSIYIGESGNGLLELGNGQHVADLYFSLQNYGEGRVFAVPDEDGFLLFLDSEEAGDEEIIATTTEEMKQFELEQESWDVVQKLSMLRFLVSLTTTAAVRSGTIVHPPQA